MQPRVPNRTAGMMIVAVLALMQSAIAVLRAFHWVDVGSDLMGQGILLFQMVGFLAYFRGGFVTVIAFLYVVFAWGIYCGRDWARWRGVTLADAAWQVSSDRTIGTERGAVQTELPFAALS